MITLLLAVTAWAEPSCPRPVANDDLVTAVTAAEQAYEDLDDDAFLEHLDQLSLQLPCLDEVVTAPVAGRVHRTLALGLFATDRDRARAHVGAVRAVTPELGIQPLVSAQHPLARAWEAPSDGSTRALPPPLGHALYVDGTPSRTLPADRAALLQVVANDDASVSTHVVYPRAEVPDYPEARSLKTPLRVGGVAAGVVALGLYGVATASASSFQQDDRDADQLRRLRATTNTSSVLSGVAGTVAVGAFSVSFVVR